MDTHVRNTSVTSVSGMKKVYLEIRIQLVITL